MKKSFLFAIILFISTYVYSQQAFIVQGNDKGLFLTHTVKAKETFFSLGRTYNLQPKDIAAFNNVDMNKGLQIGQTVNIPLSEANFSQSTNSGTPVFYVVGPSEGLYRVSVKNNGVLMTYLRKWNNLANDNLTAGQKLIVGYLNAQEAPAPTVVVVEPVKETPVAKEEVKKAEPAKTEVVQKTETEKAKPISTAIINNPYKSAGNDTKGGYFKPYFEQQVKATGSVKEQTASAGIFKTASGWQDGKYYALMDGVEVGAIIQVLNPTNNKVIYARVLDAMSGIRQNQGYDLRISNAAATALEVGDQDKFIVKVVH